MSHVDLGYAKPRGEARAQRASRSQRTSHGNLNQKSRDLPLAQFPPQLNAFRDPPGTSDPVLGESLPDLSQPSPFDTFSQEAESFPPASAVDFTLAGLLGPDAGSFDVESLSLNSSAYDAMTSTTSVYPDPRVSGSDFYSLISNNDPWNGFDTVSFNDSNMSSSNADYRPTSGFKRRKLHTDSGIDTQMSSTSPHGSSPAATARSVTKPRHFCDLCKASPKFSGFSTSNDLARHKRGVHGVFEPGEKIWRCQVHGCTCADKIWPRRDNFSSHLKRMHFNGNDDRVKEVIDTFQESYDPKIHGRMDIMKTESSRGGARLKPAATTSSPMAPPVASSFTSASIMQQYFRPGQGVQQYAIPDQYQGGAQRQRFRGPRTSLGGHATRPSLPTASSNLQIDFRTVDPSCLTIPPQRNMTRPSGALTAPPNAGTRSRQKRELEDESQVVEQYSHNKPSMEDLNFLGQGVGQQSQFDVSPLSNRSTEHHTINLEANVSYPKPVSKELQDLFAKLSPAARNEAKNLFRTTSPETLARFLNKTENDEESHQTQNTRKRSVSKLKTKKKADDEKTLKCGYVIQQKGDKKGGWVECNSSFSSSSELRKHMKRHDKRFGCTFDRCYSKFGTKWEWKRHEHSQHIQNDAWRCRYVHNDETCQELYYDKVEFKKHLTQHFSNADTEFIDSEVEQCHLAKKWLGSFWCGYCGRIEKSNTAYGRKMDDERIDHIGGHILKGCKSSEWVELNGRGRTKGEMQEMEDSVSQTTRLNSRSTISPARFYHPEEALEEAEDENEEEEEEEDDGDDDGEVNATSPSESDSEIPPEQPRSRPPLQVSMSNSYGVQTGPMSAPPIIQVHLADGSSMSDHMLGNINANVMQQTRFHMMNDDAGYQPQNQNHSQLLQPMSAAQHGCCQCQQWSLHVDGQHECCYCRHQFCPGCSYVAQQPEFSPDVLYG